MYYAVSHSAFSLSLSLFLSHFLVSSDFYIEVAHFSWNSGKFLKAWGESGFFWRACLFCSVRYLTSLPVWGHFKLKSQLEILWDPRLCEFGLQPSLVTNSQRKLHFPSHPAPQFKTGIFPLSLSRGGLISSSLLHGSVPFCTPSFMPNFVS